jgi:hypothetical protein
MILIGYYDTSNLIEAQGMRDGRLSEQDLSQGALSEDGS